MHNVHAKNTVRYYVLIAIVLAFLFFSNDFGLIDVQKTAIVMAAGIDREGDDFIITSQIAIPQSSTQGKATQAVQIVSRGKTVAEAFDEINAKTGWYPKLVFCKLILFGKQAAQENTFDALDYFLWDEYLTDDCLIAVCEGTAKDVLNASALVDPSSSVAIGKVLSTHAERVGTVLTSSLREFAIGYFGDSKSAFLPVVKMEKQQEPLSGEAAQTAAQGGGEQSGQSGGSQSKSGESEQNKPVFSASETALFVNGKWVDTLSAEETFAYSVVKNKLQLAPYSVAADENVCTLTFKQNAPKLSLKVGKEGRGNVTIHLTVTAGVLDYSKSLPVEEIADVGDVPNGVFYAAEKKLSAEIHSVYEKARACGCDIFGVQDLLVKKGKRSTHKYKNSILANSTLTVSVRFKNLR